MTAAINISGVHKYYQDNHALKGLDLAIEQGEFFGLLGPNGAGKSTLINIIAGLTRMTQGRVSVMGHDVVSDYRRARQCLGVVPQELVYDPFFSVRELLEIQAGYFGKKRNANRAWVDSLLDGLKLSDKADANMRSLSGGMKRRVLIAQALVHKPDVLILDEPTAGVDVDLRTSLWEFVQSLHNDGHTIILTTHYLEEAENLCQRIAIINRGELIALDTKEALLAQGMGKHARIFIDLAAPLETIPQPLVDKCRCHSSTRLEINLEKGSGSVMSVLDLLRDAGADVIDIKTEEVDLEDIFLEMTRKGA